MPLRTAEACLDVLKASQQAATQGNPNARSDALTAAGLAWAGLAGAVENVRINAAGQESAAGLAEAERCREDARRRLSELGLLA